MAELERWHLERDEPRRYEQYKVATLFRPLAERFLEHVGLGTGERVLDVACGTGIVARLAAPRVGPSGKVVGIDLNHGMLAIARTLEPESGAALEWRRGDAEALPFPNASFETVLCQQGLQFFADRIGALREMRRVLVSAGRLAINVWVHEALALEVAGTPFAAAVYRADNAVCAALARDMSAALQVHRDGDGFTVPAEVHFLTARATR